MQEGAAPPPLTMQWALLLITTGFTFLWIVGSIIVICLTREPLVLIPAGGGTLPLGYIWIRITRYLFPKHAKDYELEEKRIEHTDSKSQV